jgi:AAA domain, putative AbiEii toxin, Type IV TA system/AAA ATPase domain
MAIRADSARVTSVRFKNFKALSDFRIRLADTNFLVGPNNAGKSTIISAFRALAVGLRRLAHRKPDIVNGPSGRQYGVAIPAEALPISIENVHTDLADEDTTVTFRLSNGNELQLFFPKDGACMLLAEAKSARLMTASAFREEFPIELSVIPVLGPVEHGETLVLEETVQRNITTHRASRNFRSYWYYNRDQFEDFAQMVAKTWPGMQLEQPFVANHASQELMMFCKENRIPRELFWIGSGFQIWCQLLTHLIRGRDASLVVIDEPEIYLHADMHRQLLGILRKVDADVLLATHSTEIMGEAEPSELVLVDKVNRAAERLKNVERLQSALAAVGSVHNIALSRLARSRRVVFFESDRDFKLVRMFARQCGMDGIASGLDIFPAESEGFGAWQKISSLGWGISRALDNEVAIGAVFDRDYFPDAQIGAVGREVEQGLRFSHIHLRKEIENYLLVPDALERALDSALQDRAQREEKAVQPCDPITPLLTEITERHRVEVQAQRTSREVEYRKSNQDRKVDPTTLQSEAIRNFENVWKTLEGRLTVVPGKAVLAELRDAVAERYGVSLPDNKIIAAMRKSDIPVDFQEFLQKLEVFRVAAIHVGAS